MATLGQWQPIQASRRPRWVRRKLGKLALQLAPPLEQVKKLLDQSMHIENSKDIKR
jgi:hypothetical protein